MASVRFSVEKSTSWILGVQIVAMSYAIAIFALPKVFPEVELEGNTHWIYISMVIIVFLIVMIFVYNPQVFWLFNSSVSFCAAALIFHLSEGHWAMTILGALAVFGVNYKSYQHMVIEETAKDVTILK